MLQTDTQTATAGRQLIVHWLAVLTLWSIMASSSLAQDDPDVFEFAYIGDVHMTGHTADLRTADENIEQFIHHCNTHPELQFALFGGDFFNDYETTHIQALWALRYAREAFRSLKIPFYPTKGNHECNGKCKLPDGRPDNSQIVTDREFYELFSPVSETNPLRSPEGIKTDSLNPTGNYYYRDFERQKIRLIVLNRYDSDSFELNGIHGPQLRWLAEEALNVMDKPEHQKWAFLVLCHGFQWSLTTHFKRVTMACHEGYDYTGSDSGVDFTGHFAEQGPMEFIALLHGHYHADIYNKHLGINMIGMTRGYATEGEITPNDAWCYDHFTINRRTHTIVEHRTGRGESRIFRYDSAYQVSPLMAFPGAEGFGKHTVGGRGGKVLHVTNLEDSGEGSLRWAIEQHGARTVVFDVDGTIELKTPLCIWHDSITVAGQTAPGDGICLKGNRLDIKASEVIVRYLRIRPGLTSGGLNTGGILGGTHGQDHVVLDHLSLSYCSEESLLFKMCKHFTVQWCIISNSLAPVNPKSTVNGSAGIYGGFCASYHHNLLAHHATSFPTYATGDGTNKWVDFAGNVVYNWASTTATGGGHHGQINMAWNYFKPGPASKDIHFLHVAPDGSGRYYLTGNVMEGYEEMSRINARGVVDRPGVPYMVAQEDLARWRTLDPLARPQEGDYAPSCLTVAMFPSYPISFMMSAQQIYDDLLIGAGCSLRRDSYDTELIEQVRTGTSSWGQNGIVSSPRECGGWPKLQKGKPRPDTDGDGLPDEWERQHNLNPADSTDGRKFTIQPTLTNLEVYLDELTHPVSDLAH